MSINATWRPAKPGDTPGQLPPEMALRHTLNHQYQALQAILATLAADQLVDLAEAATRLRRECEAAYHSRHTGMPTHLTPRLKLDTGPC